jgi:5-methylcytosine-specific restriction protein B
VLAIGSKLAEIARRLADNGYILVPTAHSLFPDKFVAGDDGRSQERFSLETPSGDVVRTCILGRYRRIQARFGLLFKRLKLQPGDYAVIEVDESASDRYILTFENLSGTSSETINLAERDPVTPDLNRIFYGPPGTGKTYATVDAALEVLDPDFLSSNRKNRDALKGRFDELIASGDIRFVTFHQSFSYEDFVEGLRAENDENGQLRYEIVDGVFAGTS